MEGGGHLLTCLPTCKKCKKLPSCCFGNRMWWALLSELAACSLQLRSIDWSACFLQGQGYGPEASLRTFMAKKESCSGRSHSSKACGAMMFLEERSWEEGFHYIPNKEESRETLSQQRTETRSPLLGRENLRDLHTHPSKTKPALVTTMHREWIINSLTMWSRAFCSLQPCRQPRESLQRHQLQSPVPDQGRGRGAR